VTCGVMHVGDVMLVGFSDNRKWCDLLAV
jgi:hypothetical protein